MMGILRKLCCCTGAPPPCYYRAFQCQCDSGGSGNLYVLCSAASPGTVFMHQEHCWQVTGPSVDVLPPGATLVSPTIIFPSCLDCCFTLGCYRILTPCSCLTGCTTKWALCTDLQAIGAVQGSIVRAGDCCWIVGAQSQTSGGALIRGLSLYASCQACCDAVTNPPPTGPCGCRCQHSLHIPSVTYNHCGGTCQVTIPPITVPINLCGPTGDQVVSVSAMCNCGCCACPTKVTVNPNFFGGCDSVNHTGNWGVDFNYSAGGYDETVNYCRCSGSYFFFRSSTIPMCPTGTYESIGEGPDTTDPFCASIPTVQVT